MHKGEKNMRLPVGQQTLFTATVKIPLTQLIQRILYDAVPWQLPTSQDLFDKLNMLGVGRKEGITIADIENAADLLVSEGGAVSVETERGICFAWPLNREFDLLFSF